MEEEEVILPKFQRFNQGFYNFGPLEQCSEGKLMLAEEVLPVVQNLRRDLGLSIGLRKSLSRQCENLEEDLARLGTLAKDYRKENEGLRESNNWYLSKIAFLERRLAQAQFIVAAFFVAATIFGLYHFH